MTDEVVTRLYRALVEELRRRDHPEDQPVTVSELYQTLIPYAAVRSAIGVELNADYEHALLRLLAGERDLLRLEPLTAREELRREVEAPYPFVGLFRKFSGSQVRVKMPAGPASAAPAEPASAEAPAPTGSEASADDAAVEGGSTVETGPARIVAEGDTARIRTGGAEPVPDRPPIHLHKAPKPHPAERTFQEPAACGFCGEDLPADRRVRFCPYCGGDQRLRPCPRCEAVLERDWRHCISCGHEVGAS